MLYEIAFLHQNKTTLSLEAPGNFHMFLAQSSTNEYSEMLSFNYLPSLKLKDNWLELTEISLKL